MGLDELAPFSLVSVAYSFSLFFIHRILLHSPSPTNYVGTSLQRESKPGLSHRQFLYFVSCVFISSRVRQLTLAINARSSAPPIPYHVHSYAFSGMSLEGWSLAAHVMGEFLITFALLLQLHPPITLVLPWRLLLLFTYCFVLILWNFRVCLPRALTVFYRRFRAPTDD